MDDQFDKDLKKRIREVFDNYEDDSADKGWALLRKKYPGKAKKRPIVWMWWSSAAAILLLFLSILWFKQSPEKQQQHFTAVKKAGSNIQPAKSPGANNDQNAVHNPAVEQPDHTLASATDHNTPVKSAAAAPPNHAVVSGTNQGLLAANRRNNPSDQKTPTNSPMIKDQNKNPSAAGNTSANATTLASLAKPENTNTANLSGAAKLDTGNTSSQSNVIAATPGINMQQPEKFDKQLLADNSQQMKQKGLSKNSLVHFGVYAATYFNYAKGSSSQFNVGAGLSADINLTRKLKVSTGIAIAQNSLSYPGQASFSTPAGINQAPLALYSASALQYSVSEPSFRNYSANLVGIDIPLNLKYTFDPGKTETYLLAGLSSGTFIDETYTYSFNNAQAQSQTARGGFYFAKMLNLAIGTGYRVGNNRLIIEPFLKYPLEGMGTQQIRFGSGGVNLRFSIPSQSR